MTAVSMQCLLPRNSQDLAHKTPPKPRTREGKIFDRIMKQLDSSRQKGSLNSLQIGSPLTDKNGTPLKGGFAEIYRTNIDGVLVKISTPKSSYHEVIFSNECSYLRDLTNLKVPHSCRQYCFEVVRNTRSHEYRSYQKYCGLDLFTVCPKRFRTSGIESIAKQLLEYLFSIGMQNLAHCDLTLCNSAIDRFGDIWVFDLQFMSKVPFKKPYTEGTQSYLSPETLFGLTIDKSTDIWSLGCILFALATGKNMFSIGEKKELFSFHLLHSYLERLGLQDQSLEKVFPQEMLQALLKTQTQIVQVVEKKSPSIFSTIDKESEQKVGSTTTLRYEYKLQPKKKGSKPLEPIGETILKTNRRTTKVEDLIDLIEQMMQIDPKKRITPKKALQHRFFTEDRSDVSFKPIVIGDPRGFWLSIIGKLKSIEVPLCEVAPCYHLPITKDDQEFLIMISSKLNGRVRILKLEKREIAETLTYTINTTPY